MQETDQKHRGVFLWVVALVLVWSLQLCAQTTPNRVLELDGTNSYVQIPPHIFDDLTEATVELWVEWDRFGPGDALAFCFGEENQGMFIGSDGPRPELKFALYDVNFARHPVAGNGSVDPLHVNLLRAGEWCHVAGVSGPGGMQLYFNGTLVGMHNYPGSFAQMPKSAVNFLGRSTWRGDVDLRGHLDEVRVWKHRRTEAQIRENMFKRLAGDEAGLAALWNFDDVNGGVVKDLSPGAHDGKLIGNARFVSSQLPTSAQLPVPRIVFGTVKDETGKPVANATIRLLREEAEIVRTTSDTNGSYSIPFVSEHEKFDVNAAGDELGNWRLGIACPRRGHTEVNLTLSNSVSIAGKVTLFDGSLIEEAVIQIVRADAPAPEARQLVTPGLVATLVTATITNSSQAYQVLNLRPGDYKVKLHVPDAQVTWHGGEIVHVAPGKVATVDFQVAPFRKGRWRRYSTANGLLSARILDLQFIPDGTLWLAT